jgi:hypothetical protein
MKWSRILAQLGKLAALFVVVPVLLIVRLRWDAILPIIIYLQLLLIWVQAEISLRQTALFAAQFEPAFDIKVGEPEPMTLTIENVSENPAYNVSIVRVLDAQGVLLQPKQWESKLELDRLGALAPREKRRLCVLKDQALQASLMTYGGSLELAYFTRRGEWQTLQLLFSGGQLLIVPGGALPPGVLLRTFESVSSIWTLLLFRRRLKSKGKA